MHGRPSRSAVVSSDPEVGCFLRLLFAGRGLCLQSTSQPRGCHLRRFAFSRDRPAPPPPHTHTHTRSDSVVIQSNIKTSGLKLRYACQVRYLDSLNVELSAWKRKLSLFGWTVPSGSRQHRRACGTTKLLPPQAPLTKCSHPGIHALFVIEERFHRGAGDS